MDDHAQPGARVLLTEDATAVGAFPKETRPGVTRAAGGDGSQLSRYDIIVILAVGLLCAVRIEPAPCDVFFGLLIGVAGVRRSRTLAPLAPPLVIPLLLVVTSLQLISMIAAVDFFHAIFYIGVTIYMFALAVWVAIYVQSAKAARIVVRTYVISAAIMAAVTSLAMYVNFPGHTTFIFEQRATGLFKDPNVFGPFLVVPALIIVEELIAPRLLWTGPVAMLLLTILGAGILLSYSRGAWINMVIGIIIILVVTAARPRYRVHVKRAVVILGSVIAVISVMLALTGSLKFLSQRAGSHGYDTQRFASQAQGPKLADRYPLGVGPGQYGAHSNIDAHSLYARTLGEQGYLGLIVFMCLLLVTTACAIRNAILYRNPYGLGSAALLGAWIGVLASGIFVDTIHWRHMWLLAGLIWAAALAGPKGSMRVTRTSSHGLTNARSQATVAS